MTHTTESMVTQADRDAAAGYHGRFCNAFGPTPMCCSCGVEEAFAAHRTAAQPEREAVLEEAALKAASQRHKRVSGIADCETLLDAYWNGCLDAAEAIRALKTTPSPAVSTDEIADSGMSAEAVERAEWAWANLPTGPRKWTSLTTAEKALVCHVLSRIRGEGE